MGDVVGMADRAVPEGFRLDDGTKYREDLEYTRSRDMQQHGVTVNVKVPEMIHMQIKEIVEQRSLPGIKTVADFMRSAALHHLKRRSEKIRNAHLDNTIEREVLAAMQDAFLTEMHTLDMTVKNYKEAGQLAAQSSDWRMLAVLIHHGRKAGETIRPPYSERIHDEAERLLVHLPLNEHGFLNALAGGVDVDVSMYTTYFLHN